MSGEDRNKFADKFVFVGKTRINLLIWQADNINYAGFFFWEGIFFNLAVIFSRKNV